MSKRSETRSISGRPDEWAAVEAAADRDRLALSTWVMRVLRVAVQEPALAGEGRED